jgi:murein L,D-transpeptidase YafK
MGDRGTLIVKSRLVSLLLLPLAVPVAAEQALPVAESVLVDKSERKLWLISKGRKYREYDISLGKSPLGHKQRLGDKRTPEGRYVIDYRNPESRYHLSLHIDYPRERDLQQALDKGIDPGGNIFIHGLPNGSGQRHGTLRGKDWTDGCIAVNNREIEEIWALVMDGTPIEITQ